MYWTTPKTDWNQGDHFNLDDYIRINDNISYLKDMAAEIYPQSELYAICFRERYQKTGESYRNYYTLMNMVVAKMQTYPSKNYNPDRYYSYDYGRIDFLSRDRPVLLTLLKLDYLSLYGVTTVTDVLCSDNMSGTDYFYSGNAINYSYSSTTFLPYANFWTKMFGSTVRAPMSGFELSSWSGSSWSGHSYITIAAGYPLGNEPFWSYAELNTIESRILTIYNRLNA